MSCLISFLPLFCDGRRAGGQAGHGRIIKGPVTDRASPPSPRTTNDDRDSVNLDHVLSAVANDPTLQRSEVDCPQCHHHEAVLIQSTQNVKSNKLTLIFVCCNEHCGHKWCVHMRPVCVWVSYGVHEGLTILLFFPALTHTGPFEKGGGVLTQRRDAEPDGCTVGSKRKTAEKDRTSHAFPILSRLLLPFLFPASGVHTHRSADGFAFPFISHCPPPRALS